MNVQDAKSGTEQTRASHVMMHAWHALEMISSFIQLKAAAQKSTARKISVQLGMTVLLGLFVLVWAELAVYLALSSVTAQYWAALLTLVGNGAAIAVATLVTARWRHVNADNDEAAERRIQIAQELHTARNELVAIKDSLANSAGEFVRDKLSAPVNQYKVPVALAATFVTGLLVARALFPVVTERAMISRPYR